MYCQKCGQYNEDNSIYCSNDGELLLDKNEKIYMSKSEVYFCKDCGQKVDKYSIYCKSCGQTLFQVDKKKVITEKFKTKNESKVDRNFQKIDFKSPLKFAGIAIIILVLTSIMISIGANESISNEISDVLDFNIHIKFLNFIDYALLSNLLGLTVKIGSSEYSAGIIDLKACIFLLSLIPSIIFMILGMFKGKKDLKEDKEFNLINVILVGLYYGIGLLILSLFSSKEMDIAIPYVRKSVIIVKKYSCFEVIFNSLIISLIFYLLGYGTYMFIKKKGKRLTKYRHIFNGVFLMISGYVISLIAYFVFFKKHIVSVNIAGNEYIESVINFQIPIYLWNFINFDICECSIFNDIYNISLFKNTEMLKDFLGLDNKRLIILYLLTCIPFLLFFLQGRKEKKIGDSNLYLNLIYTSLSYSFIMAVFAWISNFEIRTFGPIIDMIFDESMSISIGFNSVTTFLTCMVFSYLASLVGAFLTSPKKEGCTYNE